MRRSLLAALAVLALTGCRSSGPPPYLPGDALGTRLDAVVIPQGYSVRSASFGLSYATGVSGGTDVNGTSHAISSSSHERPFVTVFAVEDATGREVVLVYALGTRPDPVLQIELRPAADGARAAH